MDSIPGLFFRATKAFLDGGKHTAAQNGLYGSSYCHRHAKVHAEVSQSVIMFSKSDFINRENGQFSGVRLALPYFENTRWMPRHEYHGRGLARGERGTRKTATPLGLPQTNAVRRSTIIPLRKPL
jgi:hypothetical protein